MGTALTGLQIGSTYNGLLKTTDNAAVNATLRTITDGLGNDTALQVSSAGVKSTGTLGSAGRVTTDFAGDYALTEDGGTVRGVLSMSAAEVVTFGNANNNLKLIGSTGVADLTATGLAVTGVIGCSSSAPASASATGVAGTITWDASYVYVCTATNTWKRVGISTW